MADRNFVFGEAEREEFSRMMRAAETFLGVRVLAWTILSNHFHMLLEVPERLVGFDLEEGGQLTTAQLLRCRVRHFTDGLVLGSKAFVNGYFEVAKANFGARRRSGAGKLKDCSESGLFTIRDLRWEAR